MNPLFWPYEVGVKLGTVLSNSILTGKAVGPTLAEVLTKSTAPVVINNPESPKSLLDNLGIGFIEKNVIIIGVFALGAVAIYSTINKKR